MLKINRVDYQFICGGGKSHANKLNRRINSHIKKDQEELLDILPIVIGHSIFELSTFGWSETVARLAFKVDKNDCIIGINEISYIGNLCNNARSMELIK